MTSRGKGYQIICLLGLVTLGVITFLVVNRVISNMGVGGLAVNTIGLFLLILIVSLKDKSFIALYIGVSALLGPFFIVNLSGLDMPNIGRADYFLCLTLLAAIAFSRKTIPKLPLFCFFVFLFLSGWAWWLSGSGELEHVKYGDVWFAVIGKVAAGIVLYLLLKESLTTVYEKSVGKWLVVLVILHLLVSWVQLFFPFNIRLSTIESGLPFFGVVLNRPVGFLEASYVYGVTTVGVWFLAWRFSKGKSRQFTIYLLPFLIPVAVISTRSVAIGISLFLLIVLWRRSSVWGRVAIAIFILISSVWLLLQGERVVGFVDASNATKLMLWWLAITKWVGEFPVAMSIFGYGYDSTVSIAAGLGFTELASELGSSYDNRIDLGGGFPIHNVFIQFLFEFGLLAGFILIGLIFRGLVNILRGNISVVVTFFWCVVMTNYCFHNGAFSPWLIAAILLTAFPTRKNICLIDKSDQRKTKIAEASDNNI